MFESCCSKDGTVEIKKNQTFCPSTMDINNNIHIILKSIFRIRVYSGKVKVRLNPLPALFWCRGCESTGGAWGAQKPSSFFWKQRPYGICCNAPVQPFPMRKFRKKIISI